MFTLVAYFVSFLALAAAAAYLYLRNVLTFWPKRNVPTAKNPNVLWGNFSEVFAVKKPLGEKYRELYNEFGESPMGGVYMLGVPLLLIKDLDLVKQVFVKDFSSFHGRGFYYDTERQPMSGHLFALNGPKWRRMRVKLTPTFTTGKLKMMFETLSKCSVELTNFLNAEIKKNNGEMNIRETLARFSTDVIASVAFGIQCNSIHNPDAEFRVIGKRVFEPTLNMFFRNMTYFFVHPLAKLLNIAPADQKVTKFMKKVIYDTVQYREANNITRPDFLNLMIEMKNSDNGVNGNAKVNGKEVNGKEPQKDTTPITMDEIVAQAFVFFIAGYETTSTTTGFALWELARHQDVQTKLRQEIDEALKKSGGKVTYELVAMNLPYADKVVNETLRLFPAVPFLTRQADGTVDLNREPGKPPLTIHKGQLIAISVSGIHMDPKYYPDPEKFDPERFSPENIASRPNFAHIPFGEGPRICIGMRFGLIQVKLALATLLSRFKIEVCSKTPDPMKLDPKTIVPFPVGGLYLRLVPRTDRVSTAA